MKIRVLLAAAVLAVVPSVAVRAEAQPAARVMTLDSVRALLPAGALRVDVMDVAAPPRLTELNQRLQAAIQADPAWFTEARARATPGQPLPYDPRLGVTEPEYQEFLALAGSLAVHELAEAQLTVRADGERRVLDGGVPFADLTGITLDLAADELTTPLGVIRGSTEVHSDGRGAAIGAWDGRQWRLEQGSPESGGVKVVELSLGRLRESGRGVFYWELREARGGQTVERLVRLFFFDPPR